MFRTIFIILMIISSFTFGKSVLIIGDSMAEAIDKPITKILNNNNIECKVYYKRGTKVDYWIENKDIFLNDFTQKPDIVLISLGTNDIIAEKTNEQIIIALDALIDIVTSLGVERDNIVVIATPIHNDKGLNEALEEHYGKHVFLSKKINLEFYKDKIHPTIQSDIVWATAIINYLKNVLLENDKQYNDNNETK